MLVFAVMVFGAKHNTWCLGSIHETREGAQEWVREFHQGVVTHISPRPLKK